MNTTDFSHIHEAMDPEAKVGAFISTILSILDKTVPLKKISITNTDKPWMNVQIKDLIKDRQCAFFSGDKTSYRKIKSIIAKIKSRMQINNITNMRWRFKSVKKLMGMEGDKNDMVSQDQNIMQRECDSLARHFASVWHYASLISLSEEEVTYKLSNCSVPPRGGK